MEKMNKLLLHISWDSRLLLDQPITGVVVSGTKQSKELTASDLSQWLIKVFLTFEWPIGHDNDYCKWHKTIRIIIWVWIKSVNHNRCKSKEKWTSIRPSNPLHSSPRNNVPIWIQRSREQINDEIYSWNRYGTSSITNLTNSRR